MIEELKAKCDELGIKYHHKAGEKKLKELLAAAEGTNTPDEVEKPVKAAPEASEGGVKTFIENGETYKKTFNAKGDSIKVEKL